MIGINQKRILLFFLVILASSTAVFLYNSVRGEKNISFIKLVVVPSGSTAKLDGEGVKAGTLKLKPGNHTVIVAKKGFTTQVQKFNLQTEETRFVGIALISNSADTRDWYRDHPEDQRLLESISSQTFDQYSKEIAKKTPLVNDLPLIDRLFRIDYGQSQQYPNDPSAIAIYITYYSQEGKQQALDWIKFKGYDPTKLEIIYKIQ